MRYLKTSHCLLAALLSPLGGLLCGAQDFIDESKASYLTIQVPGALGTYPMALNNSLVVTGYYLVSPTDARAFIQDGNGTITTFSVRGSMWTEPESINSGGEITGFFEMVPGVPEGFLRRADGEIVTFNPPGSSTNRPQALPVAINDYGQIAGSYPFPLAAPNGFRRSKAGMFSTFDFTGEGAAYGTSFTGLNSNGTVVGFNEAIGSINSFYLDQNGYVVSFGFPAEAPAGYVVQYVTTYAQSINADGSIAGWYVVGLICTSLCSGTDFYNVGGGFVRSPQGTFTSFNAPGPIVTSPQANVSDYGSLIAPNRLRINHNGTITGSYMDANNIQHGFVRDSMTRITSFDPPRGRQTSATSINDSGVIAGCFYYDWNDQLAVGFLRIPKM